MILLGIISFALTLVICLATDVIFVFSMMLGLNGFTGKNAEDAFEFYIIAVLLKTGIVSVASGLAVAFLSEKQFFTSIIASILLVLSAIVIFSIINLAIDFAGAFLLIGYLESSRPKLRKT